jgi:amino acid adenylation domain-containing protein
VSHTDGDRLPAPLRCVLIGETSLVVQCAETLLERGHHIEALVSDEVHAARWARSHAIRSVAATVDLGSELDSLTYDFLFSVVNGRILKPAALKTARRGAINYHDAPLPRYAGVNATTWAILAGETRHAITWHLIDDGIDTGDVLVQRDVPIDPDETSLSLNTKCYEAALLAFGDMVDGLADGSIAARPQDLSQRTYFGREHVPAGGAIIDWTSSAAAIDRLLRALTFGPHDNSVGAAKVLIGGDLYLCRSGRRIAVQGAVPGTVLQISSDALQVACEDGAIQIDALTSLDGAPVSILALARRLNLVTGSRLDRVEPTELAGIEAVFAELTRHERFWMRRLSTVTPATHPFVGARAESGDQRRLSPPSAVPQALLDVARDAGASATSAIVALIGAYLTRVNREETCHVAYASGATHEARRAAHDATARVVPLELTRLDGDRFADATKRSAAELARVATRVTYVRDAVTRYVGLSSAPPDLPLGLIVGDAATCELPAPVTFVVEPEGTSFRVAYDARLDDDDAASVMAHLDTLMAGAGADPRRPLSDISLSPRADAASSAARDARARRDSSGAPAELDQGAFEQFEARAAENPTRVALRFNGETLTYGELARRSSELAARLRSLGVVHGTVVAVGVERSFDLPLAFLAVLKSGGVYLPVDVHNPLERLRFTLEDSGASVILTQTPLLARLPDVGATIVCMDRPAPPATPPGALAPVAGDDLAYCIYTSGSTGRPKGVLLAHRGLCNIAAEGLRLGYTEGSRVLQFASCSFDASVMEMILALSNGGTLVLASHETISAGTALLALMRDEQISVALLPPPLLRVLPDTPLPSLTTLLVGGDACDRELVARWAPGRRLVNAYGPTEATVFVSTAELSADDTREPTIGRAIANTELSILDRDGSPMPAGLAGELCIRGVGVGRGYLNRPELTAAKFVHDPASGDGRFTTYRTGDLARIRRDGQIEFLGRLDHQVKIRGYRIELGEIEAIARQHDAVEDAIVEAREDSPGMKRIVAYVRTTSRHMSAADWRAYFRERLPEYMVPAAVVGLESFPLTPAGKIDRKALPAPESVVDRGDCVSPRDDVESRVLEIWKRVLGSAGIGVTDHFNDVGGHSLAAVKVFGQIEKEFGRKLQLVTILKHDTVAQLAALLKNSSREDEWQCIVPYRTTGSGPTLFCAHAATGNVIVYESFAKMLGDDVSVYAIQALGNWGDQEPLETIEDMATHYADEVSKIQPQGPYAFFGMSMGGLIALELAQVMTQRGHQVCMVGMFDTFPPGYPKYTRWGRITLYLKQHGGISLWRLRHVVDLGGVTPRSARVLWTTFLGRLRTTGQSWWRTQYRNHIARKFEYRSAPRDYPLPDSVSRVRLTSARVIKRYQPRFYPGKITLFRAMAQGAGAIPDPTNGWAGRSAELETHSVPGTHDEAMYQPGVVSFAKLFRSCLLRAHAGSLAPERAAHDEAHVVGAPAIERELNQEPRDLLR